jgi:RNA polymerase sigma-70 factor, ECF subfamily
MVMMKPSMVHPSRAPRPPFNRTHVRYGDMTDVQLVSACKLHDRIAFNWLVKRYERSVFAILYKLAPDLIDPADLVQDVFLRLWSCISKLDNPHAFRSWLKRIVTNILYDHLRRRPRQSILSIDSHINFGDRLEEATMQIVDPSAQPDELSERRETAEAIQRSVASLPCLSKRMIELRESGGRSYSEIAELTSCPVGTVKSRIARARRKLYAMLLPYKMSTIASVL